LVIHSYTISHGFLTGNVSGGIFNDVMDMCGYDPSYVRRKIKEIGPDAERLELFFKRLDPLKKSMAYNKKKF